jgi:Protein of unknown function (DUF3750)
MKRLLRWCAWTFLVVYLMPLAVHAAWWTWNDPATAWNRADWSSAKLLPAASAKRDAMVHVYAARVGRWRGIFADHTWIVVKEKSGSYTRYDKTFWGNPVKVNEWVPDAKWFGHTPELVGRVEGVAAEILIPKIKKAVADYPHRAPGGYHLWPGPNSNSFVAHVLRRVPEAGIAMPPTAIGKDFRTDGWLVGRSPSGTGFEFSLFGFASVVIGWVEGFEVSLLGLTAGIDVRRPALKLPGFGRIGMSPV